MGVVIECKHCGATIDEAASFCDQCGEALTESVTHKPQRVSPVFTFGSAVERERTYESPTDWIRRLLKASFAFLATVYKSVMRPSEIELVQSQPQAEAAPFEARIHPLRETRARKGAPLLLLSHWGVLLQGLQISSMEFYVSVQRAIAGRGLPDTEMSHVKWPEGGIFSAKRVYLRVRRKDHVFDICGAPFGNGFFVSWWLGETPTVSILYLLAMFLAISLLISLAIYAYDTWGLVIAVLVTLAGLLVTFRLLARPAAETLDYYLLQLPWVGTLYERFFRPITYYRIDTALMFQAAVDGAVKEVIDELTKAKGLRALSELERKPIMRDFLRR
ncbi:zinc ribbon domain-containing protein [Acidobacteria bacterium AH-259-D05]|nr:zinc ribbon domain-containing protein [Acidobacteria bacterium AH-259-D05]